MSMEEYQNLSPNSSYNSKTKSPPPRPTKMKTVNRLEETSQNSSGNSEMDKFITLVNSLQDAFISAGVEMALELPQMVAIGYQGAGKSSVLENFVGERFLPRGSDFVTRKPLVLKLINSKDEYGVFLHDATRKFSIDQIRDEIEAETNRETGPNGDVFNRSINLTIYSPKVLNLTLIDLPRLTRVRNDDQHSEISKQIYEMALSYISQENCLIVAISPANADLAKYDALSIAKKVDPEGKRTIGVITKLDLMDSGTNVKDLLENKVSPLKRGYIGVVNRLQASNAKNKSIESVLAEEQSFFKNHPVYSHLSQQMGIVYLQKFLNAELSAHIKKHLPVLKVKLESEIMELESQAEQFKGLPFSNDRERRNTVAKLISVFNEGFKYSLEGSGSIVEQKKLLGGARIKFLYFERYELLLHAVNDRMSRNQMGHIIENCYAINTGMFTPDKALRDIVCLRIENYKAPSYETLEEVTYELLRLTDACLEKIVTFPLLRESFHKLSRDKIVNSAKKAKNEIYMFIEAQKDYINTKHPDIMRFSTLSKPVTKGLLRSHTEPGGSTQSSPKSQPAIPNNVDSEDKNGERKSIPSLEQDESLSDFEALLGEQIQVLASKADAYLKVINIQFRDIIPKYINYHLLKAVQGYFAYGMITDLLEMDLEKIVKPSTDEASRQTEVFDLRNATKDALKILNDVLFSMPVSTNDSTSPVHSTHSTNFPSAIEREQQRQEKQIPTNFGSTTTSHWYDDVPNTNSAPPTIPQRSNSRGMTYNR